MPLFEAAKSLRFKSFREDTCELVETIEQSFGVNFTEDELIDARTLGTMAEIILTRFTRDIHGCQDKALPSTAEHD